MPDPVFRFPAALAILGDPGGLFYKRAQFLGPGLDQARDHALLDDRIAAGAKAGAEEDGGDVAPPAARAVQIINGDAIAVELPLDRDLAVGGVLAAEFLIAVVEYQFDRGLADRLARAGAAEDHIGQGLAAQMFGRAFAHDPGDRVNDIGFAAAVWPDDADQVAGEDQVGGIDKGLEAGEFDVAKAHGALRY